jgi:hypothetical protein
MYFLMIETEVLYETVTDYNKKINGHWYIITLPF